LGKGMDVVHWATDLQEAIVRRLAGQRGSIANHDDDVKVQEMVLKNHTQTCMFVANGSFSWKMHSLGCFPDSRQRCCPATPARQLPRSALGQTLCADPQQSRLSAPGVCLGGGVYLHSPSITAFYTSLSRPSFACPAVCRNPSGTPAQRRSPRLTTAPAQLSLIDRPCDARCSHTVPRLQTIARLLFNRLSSIILIAPAKLATKDRQYARQIPAAHAGAHKLLSHRGNAHSRPSRFSTR
jgi:hypothetical protein